MQRKTLAILLCPACHGQLQISASSGSDVILEGTLTCPSCRKLYPVKRGIAHFIRPDELAGINRKFAHLYDWFSLIYAAFSKIGFLLLGTTESHACQAFIDRLKPAGKVLEVSIGPGVNLPYLLNAPGVTDVYGLDISTGQLTRCNSLIHRKGWQVDLFLGNAEELPFCTDTFDSVFHIGGINFFGNKQRAIDEMIRVAKPGTRIMICDENETGAQWYEKYLPGFRRAFQGQREKVTAPINLVPATMLDIKLGSIWNDFMYCLEFQKPIL